MRVCLICEGSYPYIAGGVSSWIQMLIEEYSDIEFTIWSIATNKEEMHMYKYSIPSNVSNIKTVYLQDIMNFNESGKIKLNKEDIVILRSLLFDKVNDTNWDSIVQFLKKYKNRLIDVIMSKEFYALAIELYEKEYSRITFSTFLWNMRSIYYPLISILSSPIEDADIYHAVSTGYAGLLGAVVTSTNNKPFLLTEHGIYTREREEEIIKSNWVTGAFKEIWIEFFHKLSNIAYFKANEVYTLFESNKKLQEELGCPSDKIRIIPNGVDYDSFKHIYDMKQNRNLNPERDDYNLDSEEDNQSMKKKKVVIGMVVRVVPIKDIKSAILAFDLIRNEIKDVEFLILGPYDEDLDYYEECYSMVKELDIANVRFEGRVDVKEYMKEIDIMLLTSISEGQPLAVLEGMAAGIPQVCTNVGSCKELLEGKAGDRFGNAGLIVPIMNIKAIANAVVQLIKDEPLRISMGQSGQERVKNYYQKHIFLDEYRKIYKKLGGI